MTLLAPISRTVSDVWLERAIACALLLACGVGLTNNSVDPDLFGHVQYGRDVFRDGHLHHTATYTYTAVGFRWINHENLSELLYAWCMDTIGPTALLGSKFLIGMGIFAWFMTQAYRRGASHLAVGLVFLLSSLSLMHFWLIRPQLLSYVCFAGIVCVLSYAFQGWEGNWHLPVLNSLFGDREGDEQVSEPTSSLNIKRLHTLWLLVPLMFLWANAHGAFIAGGAILMAYLGCRAIEIVCRGGKFGYKPAGYLLIILAAALLVTIANPYGWDLHIRLYYKLRIPRPEIIEWQPPELFSIVWIQFWLLLGLWVTAIFGATKRRDFTQLVILSLVAWQAVEHRRHIAFVVILSLAWLPPLVESLLQRFRGLSPATVPTAGMSLWPRRFVLSGFCVGLLLALGMFIDQLRMLPVPRNRYPVDAFQFMADNGLQREGKLVCQFEWAQYAILAFGQRREGEPGLRLQFDGRFRTCYPQEVLDMYWDFDMGPTPPGTRYRSPKSPPEVDGSRVLSYRDPDLVLVGRHRPHAVGIMEQRPADWVLLYQDHLAQLWGRRTRYDNPRSPFYLPPETRSITDIQHEGLVAWPAVPRIETHVSLAESL